MKKTLIAGLAAMSLITFGACGDSEETEDPTPECSTHADCGDGKICSTDNKCVDDTNVDNGNNGDNGNEEQPECTTSADCTDATKPVCDNGTCVADSTQPVECGANEYEIDGICYANGDACDSATFIESCVGSVVVYCYDGIVDTLDCSEGVGYSCDILVEWNYADCFHAEDISEYACEAGSANVVMCDYGVNETEDAYVMYSVESVCAQLATAGSYIWFATEMDECTSGACNEMTGSCLDVPAGWDAETCSYLGLSTYGDGYCECGCGVKDIDCDADSADVCEYDMCEYSGMTANATQNWICE